MVHLDVHLEVLVKTMSLEESDYCLCVNIILVLCRLHRLRLDEECSSKAL